MVKFSELLSSTEVGDLAIGTISVGDVYLMEMGEDNGIHPTPGYLTRRKYFVVLGFDGERIYGGIVINSQINMNVRGQIREQHIPLLCSRYSFLDHDSFADCLKLKTADVQEFGNWSFKGQIVQEDLIKIKNAIVSSPVETKGRLRMFGLIP